MRKAEMPFSNTHNSNGSGGGGFRFSFGGDESEGITATASWPAPRTALSTFPWISLTTETLQAWAQHYPSSSSPSAADTAAKTHTHPQQLVVMATPSPNAAPASSASPSAVVCYQTAPELAALTTTTAGTTSTTSTGSEKETCGDEARDIIPGKYYGGLKVWSCAPDLARYLLAHHEVWRQRLTTGTALVAEVGCGQAVPGLAALLLGARRLILQDYNAEVLDVCVRPNVAATLMHTGNNNAALPSSPTPVEVKLVHGDWVDLAWDERGQDGDGCDLILGADVTFDEEACDKLVDLLVRWLRPRTGVALIATKVFYFGTNGGAREFTERATRRGLVVQEAARMDDDGGMKRVILRVEQSPV